VSLLAAIGNRRTSTESEARDGQRSSGARASSLSWVLLGRGEGGGRAGFGVPMYGGRRVGSRKARWGGARVIRAECPW
jgi:hypothetical protein